MFAFAFAAPQMAGPGDRFQHAHLLKCRPTHVTTCATLRWQLWFQVTPCWSSTNSCRDSHTYLPEIFKDVSDGSTIGMPEDKATTGSLSFYTEQVQLLSQLAVIPAPQDMSNRAFH